MTFVIAAAGTGGHVFPGLAVGEALVGLGVDRQEVLFVGGDRIEASVYPDAGFPFLGVELRGLRRSVSTSNLSLPRVVWRARAVIGSKMAERHTVVALGMGGYVTIPTVLAARKTGATLLIAEQNAGAGLANRIAARWAVRSFTSFPGTRGLEHGEWVGNPVRETLANFDRGRIRPESLRRYRLEPGMPVLGVLGGSLGAGVINSAVEDLILRWKGPRIQVVHLTGRGYVSGSEQSNVNARRHQIEFEDRMDLFYAASDLVIARAGGGVAELSATATPAILVPGEFGSSGHQTANADYLREAGAALVLRQDALERLPGLVEETILQPEILEAMGHAASKIAKPDAARTIAAAMMEMAR